MGLFELFDALVTDAKSTEKVSLLEDLGAPVPCDACGGTGMIQTLFDCTACFGTGYQDGSFGHGTDGGGDSEAA